MIKALIVFDLFVIKALIMFDLFVIEAFIMFAIKALFMLVIKALTMVVIKALRRRVLITDTRALKSTQSVLYLLLKYFRRILVSQVIQFHILSAHLKA